MLKPVPYHHYVFDIYQAVEKNYAYLEHAEKRRQKSYVEDHEVRLLEIYDNNYWEMKPAAKITGKLQTITTGTYEPRYAKTCFILLFQLLICLEITTM